jgi:hypothetical protein
MIQVTRGQGNNYFIPNDEHTLPLGHVYIFRFEGIKGKTAKQCAAFNGASSPAYKALYFLETYNAQPALGEVDLGEEDDWILTTYTAPNYSDDTSTFTEIRKERVRCV